MSEQNVTPRTFALPADLASRIASFVQAVAEAERAVTALRGSFPSTPPQHEAAGPDTDYCYGTGARWSDLMSRIDDLAAEEADRG